LQKVRYILICLWLILAGCAGSKKVADQGGVMDRDTGLEELGQTASKNLTNTGFFIQKGRISTSNENGRINLYFTMKFKNPDVYLISIRSRTGIEAFRIYLNKDTVLINDRLNQDLLIGEPYDFEKITGVPAGLLKISIGDLFINKPGIDKDMKCLNGELKIDDYYMGLIVKTIIDCNIDKVKTVLLTSGTPDEFINITYSKYKSNEYSIPGRIIINDFRRKIKISLSIEKFVVPWFGEINFIPGKGYKIKKLI
jgi:hypothetical protein